MSRQDANAAFALTSFLYGSNAPYIEDLYARYEADPEVGRCRVAVVLPEPEGRCPRRDREARGPVVAAARLAAAGTQRTHRGARRRLDRGRQGARRQGQGAGADQRRRAFQRRCRARDPQLGARAHADPRLSRPRPFPRQSRSARPAAAEQRGRTRSGDLRFRRGRSRPADLSRQGARARIRHHPRRSSASCGAPIARRSASSFCTSPTARRRAGSRSASRGRTRRSPSPAKASAPSSTSWSRPKASRNSAT